MSHAKRDPGADVVLDYTASAPALVARPVLPRCPDCDAATTAKPHAPHWVGGRLVDCAGGPT